MKNSRQGEREDVMIFVQHTCGTCYTAWLAKCTYCNKNAMAEGYNMCGETGSVHGILPCREEWCVLPCQRAGHTISHVLSCSLSGPITCLRCCHVTLQFLLTALGPRDVTTGSRDPPLHFHGNANWSRALNVAAGQLLIGAPRSRVQIAVVWLDQGRM